MNRTGFQILLAGLLLLLIIACDRNRVFEEYQPIPHDGWHKDALINFNVPITDTFENHNLYINVRNDVKYSYSNLWLFVEINQPGEISVTDTFELSLADPSGRWLGDGFGGVKTRQVVFRRNVFFPVSGEYKFNIQHGMREELLQGITDIGFRVEKLD
jgi:gliding motility-associated lipoprotein GldH